MASDIILRKGKLSKALWNSFNDYYKSVGADNNYTSKKWQQWKDSPGIIKYLAEMDAIKVGWIIYDPEKSTIVEILVSKKGEGEHIVTGMIDALVLRENLVTAEILKTDQEKYKWMIEYGFRPTRSFAVDGLSFLRMDLSIAVLFKKLAGHKPARIYRKTETVAIQKVSDAATYDGVKSAMKALIDKLGGLKRYVNPGQTVVIKPNLVADHGINKDGVYIGGIVTDIRVIKALIELLLPIAGKIIIAEGSSINRSQTAKQFSHYGYDKLIDLDPSKVSLVDLNTDELVEKQVPRGKRMLSRKIPLTLEKADVIINIPVMKIHFAAYVSLSVKSLQGAIPPLEKYMTHFFGLWQNLVNIHHLVKPDLIIIDGIVGQEDFGPVSGIPKTMNLLIGGTNPVATDAATMRIMGLEPALSPPVYLAYMQGLGPIESEKINIIGSSIDEVKSPFKLPEININSGKDFIIHAGQACPGCRGYLHFVVSKLRKPDPKDPGRLLIDRPFDKKVNIFLGPVTETKINPEETNIFMGICQQHYAETGTHLPGCPPHAEVIMKGIFSLFPDVERPKYADKTEEERLEEMLNEVLANI
ncbi:MAG: DUF362 domain-containing protein [Proteobacteria bacterium]|nr:DUF362 domain-containing protein [Pseudomonadota bacterium]